MNTYQEKLLEAKGLLGGFTAIGKICGVSYKAVSKWAIAGKPPRTEYSGETNYAELISAATGGQISKDDLLPRPKHLVEKLITDLRTHEQRVDDCRAHTETD